MAIVLDQVTTNSSGGGNVTISNVTVSNNTDRLLLVSLASHQGGGASGVKYNGVAMTKLVSQIGQFNETAEIWGLVNPDVGTTFSVVTSGVPGGSFTAAAAISLYNCLQALPTNSAKATGNSSSPSLSIMTQYDNSWVVDAIESEAGLTVGGSQVQDWNIQRQSYENGAGSHILVASAGSQTMSWTNSSAQRWNQCAVEVLLVGDITTSTSSTSSSSSTSSTSSSSSTSSTSSSSTSSTSSSTSSTSSSTSSTSTSSTSSSTTSTSTSSTSSSTSSTSTSSTSSSTTSTSSSSSSTSTTTIRTDIPLIDIEDEF